VPVKKPFLRWITVIGLLIAVPVAYSVAHWTRRTFLLNLNERARDELNVHLSYMQSQMDNLYTITRIMGTDERVLALLQNPGDRRSRSRVNHYLARYHVTTGSIAYILDAQGKVLASGNWDAPDTFVGQKLGFRPYFQASIVGQTAQYVAIGTTSHRLGYYVSIPIIFSLTRRFHLGSCIFRINVYCVCVARFVRIPRLNCKPASPVALFL